MTTTLLAPEPALGPTGGLQTEIDRLTRIPLDQLNPREHAILLADLARAKTRLAALELRVLASADNTHVAATTGAASTGAWAAKIVNTDQIAAQRQVGLAVGLQDRTATSQALARGAISPDHAAVIVQADRDLPPRLSPAERAKIEATLLDKARAMAPTALRRAARRALEAVEPDPAIVDAHENDLVEAEEARAHARIRLTLHDDGHGSTTGHFTIPTRYADILRKIAHAMTAPRRARLGASQAQTGPTQHTDWDHARGLAFCEILEHLPTDHLHPKTAATLVITIQEDVLRGAVRVAGLDTGGAISAGETRRLACNSTLIPAVLSTQSQILDLGRSSRLFTQPQRIALSLKHQHCAADGCERPFAWCELHHLKPWSHGGNTNLDQALPLCHFHHQRIHDHHYQHTTQPNGSITFHRRT